MSLTMKISRKKADIESLQVVTDFLSGKESSSSPELKKAKEDLHLLQIKLKEKRQQNLLYNEPLKKLNNPTALKESEECLDNNKTSQRKACL